MKLGSQISILGRAAICSIIAGGLGSLVFMHLVGRHNNSAVLMTLFTFWVSSPFVANAWLWFAVVRSSLLSKAPFFSVILALSLGSLLVYGFVARGARLTKPAFPFLITPLVSWIVIGLVTASVLAKKGRHDGA